MASWTILTCEFPPECGGVGDYTAQVARALAACGDQVSVFCPPFDSRGSRRAAQDNVVTPVAHAGVDLIALPDTYGRASRQRIAEHVAARSTTVLVQYVPTAYGLKGANVPWCRWLLDLSRRRTDVRVMFHEPYFTYGWKPLHQGPLSFVQRRMARILLQAGGETYLSTDSWRRHLIPYAAEGTRRRFVTLPIPSSIPRCDRPESAAERRRALVGRSRALVGHFGTYGTHVAPMLREAASLLLSQETAVSLVCAGHGSDRFAADLIAARPELKDRVHATGRLAAPDAAAVISACDLVVQPFPDGVTTRRTSVMAALHNGRPVLTTTGHLTEPVWSETGAVAMTPAGDTPALVAAARSLLSHPADLAALAARGDDAYRRNFALVHTIHALRRNDESAVA
jgi:glycosyltransferase involved in cell wall biosynthesis